MLSISSRILPRAVSSPADIRAPSSCCRAAFCSPYAPAHWSSFNCGSQAGTRACCDNKCREGICSVRRLNNFGTRQGGQHPSWIAGPKPELRFPVKGSYFRERNWVGRRESVVALFLAGVTASSANTRRCAKACARSARRPNHPEVPTISTCQVRVNTP